MVVQNGGKDRVDEQGQSADLVHNEHGRWLSIEHWISLLPCFDGTAAVTGMVVTSTRNEMDGH